MKKLFFIILISICFSSVYSQKLQLGLKLSPQFGWLKTDNPTIMDNDGLGIGFSYGLIGNYFFQDNYGINIELCHSVLQYTSSYRDTSNSLQIVKWNQQYIEIPVSLKMQTNEMGGLTYYGKIGISPMFNTSAKLNEVNNKEEINFFNASVLVGAGVHYGLGGNTLLIGGFSFHNGLIRMNKKNMDIVNDHLDGNGLKEVQLKPSYLAIDLGILF
ncbi:MAG: PorT family protein [Bacteroidetes bacterium]|nr:PorT family protein [Bacteroidota bacterium]MBL6962963.1 PorT family protein [Bacteroidota bacterium]